MRNKTKRLLTIRKLIESELISSQEELMLRLKELGVDSTQSTLSRDLKFMKVAKIPHKDRGYIYVIPENIQNEQREEKVSAIITDTILSIDFSGSMAIIKTLPGYATAVAALIDNENYFEILGSIASFLPCAKASATRNWWTRSSPCIPPYTCFTNSSVNPI